MNLGTATFTGTSASSRGPEWTARQGHLRDSDCRVSGSIFFLHELAGADDANDLRLGRLVASGQSAPNRAVSESADQGVDDRQQGSCEVPREGLQLTRPEGPRV